MMTVTFDPTFIGTGRIFPASIESTDWIGYHGTSSYYSADIDTSGFQQKKPLPVADLEHLVNIASLHGEDASDVNGFIRLQSLSFTPISELALFFVRPDSFGGQGLLHVKVLIDALFQKHATALSSEEKAHMTAVEGQIALIRSQQPVIYAINLQGLTRMDFGRLTLAIRVCESVPPERLVAKMQIDKAVEYDAIDVKGLRKKISTILTLPEAHYIKQLPPI